MEMQVFAGRLPELVTSTWQALAISPEQNNGTLNASG